jgi:Pentapeptide repeats (8 copies)
MNVLKRWAAWPQGIRWLAWIAAVVLGLAIAWVLFVPVADWLAHHDVGSATGPLHETALDNARGRLLTLGAGLFAASALLFTARTFTLSREGQVTDRYTKAIEQLGSEKLDVRIGGIYALERVASDSARDHPAVMEVLTALIREHSYEQWPPPDRPASYPPGVRTRPDVQAALTVIGRRLVKRDIRPMDLSNTNLVRADLNSSNLAGASLTCAVLTHAILVNAILVNADIVLTDLTKANLVGADLTDAILLGVKLAGADLAGADLTGALWSEEIPVPEGWERDAGSGRLERADTDSGPAETG